MAHSVVKVTDAALNDSLFLLVGEDGTVTPDRETVESFLGSRDGPTDLQIMHISKSDGKSIEVSVDNLTYINSDEIDDVGEDMDEVQRNLLSFRLDHDYTPLTSPSQNNQEEEEAIDELAETLRILDGSNTELPITPIVTKPTKPVKIIKATPKAFTKNVSVPVQNVQPKTRGKIAAQEFKQPKVSPVKHVKTKAKVEKIEEPINEDDLDDDEYLEEDFADEDDDEDDSDFEIEDVKIKTPTRGKRTRSKSQSEKKTPVPAPKAPKPATPKITKVQEPEINTVEKTPEPPPENKQEKKPQKKEKKTPKPMPNDFALFSTPDIIRRVGGKEPGTPMTPVLPESPVAAKPAKITPENRSKSSTDRTSVNVKSNRLSADVKVSSPDKRRPSVDKQKPDTRKTVDSVNKVNTDMVQIQNINENTNSSEGIENTIGPIPTVEDIRSVILNENTKSYTTSLVLPESNEINTEQNIDKNSFNLETAGLDLDQSILDNINSDLISEDILYQVAKQLVDNTDLQNVIDKSIVDGNLVLDPSLQSSIIQSDSTVLQQAPISSTNQPIDSTAHPDPYRGTQIVRPDGRIVVIPPIERPTTRSRNKKQAEPSRPVIKQVHKPLDEEHVSGNELDSSESEEDKSEDDPDKLWCICNQPHNNRFMICCDTCEEWYHGKCVNVTKAMGQLMEQEGREWICVYCKDPSLKRPSAAARRIRKASRASTDSSGSTKKATSSSSLIETVKTTTTSPSKPSVLACIVCGKPSRKNSIYCSEACILRHAQGVERVVVFDRTSGKILSGNKAPSAANLEKWLQAHPGYEVVRSTSKNIPRVNKNMTQSKLKLVKNQENEGVSLAVHKKGVNIGVLQHSPKHLQHQQQQAKNPLKAHITGLKVVKKQPHQTSLLQHKQKVVPQQPVLKSPVAASPSSSSSSSAPRQKQTVQTTLKSPPVPKDKPIPQKTPKARQAEQQPQPKQQENIRENICKTLSEQLMNRLKKVDDLKLTEEQVNNISTEIESQLFKCFGDTGQKYKNKYRSLIFNIKDAKNQTLWRRICEKAINPYQLVRLSPDDLASQELALWREREAKHQLDMIKKSELELLNCNRQFVFKTHKGEQVLEDGGRPTDAIDSTEVIASLGADSTSIDSGDSKHDKDKEKKSSAKHSRRDRDRDRKSSKEKSDSKDGRHSRERDRRKRSRSKEHTSRHSDRKHSRSRDRDRHRRSSHKSSSRHRKELHVTTDKLDKKSKEILEQLVDKQIVPPLEDRLWKHVQQEDITAAPHAESDSDHEPSSTVTIPTPPRSIDPEELQHVATTSDDVESKDGKKTLDESSPVLKDEQDGSRSPTRPPPEFVWKGSINMVDVAQISITAHEVSGDCNGLGEELPSNLDIVGRISPDTVWDYIGKMKCSNSKVISLIRLNATNVEEKMPYIALYSYLSSRNRLGVVKSMNKAVKDFYILPLAVQKPIPQVLLPISGPGFEESRPPLLLGIIVRDKKRRPLYAPEPQPPTKRIKVEIAVPEEVPPTLPQTTAVAAPPRSYTPPPNRDPRLKLPPAPATVPLPVPAPIPVPAPVPAPVVAEMKPEEEQEEVVEDNADGDDMDEPYSPEDSDPDTTPAAETGSRLNADDLSNLLTGSVKTSSFLESGLKTQTFEPFTSKFDTIPGLEDTSTLPSSSQELARKMAELDQRIALQKAEIDNMSQDIVSSATGSADLGTNALANIALPSNLQQILDSIKTIGAATSTDSQDSQVSNVSEVTAAVTVPTTSSDLTIPLLLPKISSRTQKSEISTDTIPLNIPTKPKRQALSTSVPPTVSTDPEKVGSVLSSLSEEDLIRKAAEMLGEKEEVSVPPAFNPSVPPPPITLSTVSPAAPTPPKRPKLDLPPVPGLEDET